MHEKQFNQSRQTMATSASSPSSTDGSLPCVIQVGFAGSRRLFPGELDDDSRQRLEQELQQRLHWHLQALVEEAGAGRFLCGLSQVAIGGDTLFTRACRQGGIPQRIFLPQPEQDFLHAADPDGTPDFTPAQRQQAEALLNSDHIIECRVVSHARRRNIRFEDANWAIVQESDLVICLRNADDGARPGGTTHLLELARQLGLPVLDIRVALRDGALQLQEQRHGFDHWSPPALPAVLDDLATPVAAGEVPSVRQFAETIKRHADQKAERERKRFESIAGVVIITHILATLLATLVLATHGEAHGHAFPWLPVALLAAELGVLGWGYGAHRRMHHANPSKPWALSRLVTEINRSVAALGHLRMPLDYLFRLRLPEELRPLLRTLNVLHLHHGRNNPPADWQALRDAYLRERLTDPDPAQGQIAYYDGKIRKEQRALRRADRLFNGLSIAAIAAVGVKLATVAGLIHWPAPMAAMLPQALGVLAVVLPVLAVGVLSWAAAQDYEGRIATFSEMRRFLQRQEKALRGLRSRRGLHQRVEETELALLGETAEWYARRSHGKVV